MSRNYAKELPQDTRGMSMQEYPPPFIAKAVSATDNATVSSVITLDDNCSTVEVSAVGGAAAIKWIAIGNTNPSVITLAGTANLDHVIPSGTTRKFVVPQETQGTASIVGINKQAGLYNRMAVKSVGVSSVITTQY